MASSAIKAPPASPRVRKTFLRVTMNERPEHWLPYHIGRFSSLGECRLKALLASAPTLSTHDSRTFPQCDELVCSNPIVLLPVDMGPLIEYSTLRGAQPALKYL